MKKDLKSSRFCSKKFYINIVSSFKNILQEVKALAIDLDGVIYAGDKLLPYAKEFIELLHKLGKAVFFITNNSGKSRKNIAKKLNDLGIDVKVDKVYNSGYATGLFLKQYDMHKGVYIIGSDELKKEFLDLEIDISEKTDCKYLVVGFDKNFTYEKIALGFQIIQNGAKFIACNRDKSFPIEDGKSMPACNAMVAAIEYTTGKKPDYVIGKPETFMLELISRKYHFQPDEILVIGDSPETDIFMANKFGSPSVLVSEDFTKKELKSTEKPSLVVKSLKISI